MYLLKISLLAALLAATAPVHAVDLWTGPTLAFTQSADTPVDVIIAGSVTLTRAGNMGLYNTNFDTGAGTNAPSHTKWAFGALSNYTTLTYQTFDSLRNGDLSTVLLNGGPMVLRIQLTANTNDDTYIALQFTAWPHGGGPFAYTRSTKAASGPVASVISAFQLASNQFSFDYSAVSGSSYFVQRSADLTNWVSLSTNVAGSASVHFSDPTVSSGQRYYRVGALAGP